MQLGRSVPLLLLIGWLAPAALLPVPEKQDGNQLPLICPALKYAEKPFLAVVGTPIPIGGDIGSFEIQIDRVLSGSWNGSGVQVYCSDPLPPRPQVVVLVPDKSPGSSVRSFGKELSMDPGRKRICKLWVKQKSTFLPPVPRS